jgi:transposase
MRGAIGDDFIFGHDNAPPHTARVTTTFLEEQGIEFEIMDWPSKSPDLNPIESLWDQVKNEANRHISPTTTLVQLPGIIQQDWASIRPQNIANVINNMRKRCREVIDVNGGHINY